jgi:hypothetical protein
MMVWKCPSDKTKTILHLVAIELKDSRQTELKDWQDKVRNLFSYRCLIWWLRVFYPSIEINVHVVLAGKEEVERNDPFRNFGEGLDAQSENRY